MQISESFLAYCWQIGALGTHGLKTDLQQELNVLDFGKKNADAGADFLMATIELDGLKWVGGVEIHTFASDWVKHGHHRDPAYNNVILHIVWENDAQATRQDGSLVPQLAVRDKINLTLYHNFVELQSSEAKVACSYGLHRVPKKYIEQTLETNLRNRLERKAQQVLLLLTQNRNDWEETAHQLLAKSLGFKINSEPFFQLSRRIPFRIFRKHCDNLNQLEALAFGGAGFLGGNFQEPYLQHLQNEFWYLSHKYKLEPLSSAYWKLLRLRPPNFPTLRVAQWASLMNRFPNFFSRMLFWQDKQDLEELFDCEQSMYWKTHYLPEKAASKPLGKMGKDAVHSLVINVVSPILVAYSKAGNGEQFYDKAIEVLRSLPTEKNQIIALWDELGIKSKSALHSQSLIELKTQNCDSKNCLQCQIGQFLISGSN